jgi:GDSL/SGNH-like Acyl-Esterase family found in Pmr5 and Cas1p
LLNMLSVADIKPVSRKQVDGVDAVAYPSTVDCGIELKPFNVTFVRNSWLELNHVDLSAPNLRQYRIPWVPLLEPHNISILVMNRGAHYMQDHTLLEDLNRTIAHLTEHFPQITKIYRDTPSGQPNCHKMRNWSPLPNPQLNYFSRGVDYEPSLSWHNFDRQNQLTRALIQRYHPDIYFMEISRMMSYRADSHYDCLHWCLPGPIDQWVASFIDVVRVIDTPELAAK